MGYSVKLYSEKLGEISKFVNEFFSTTNQNSNIDLIWEKHYDNPIEITDIIGAFIENADNYDISMWINLDDDVYINVTENNANELIRYIFERFPY